MGEADRNEPRHMGEPELNQLDTVVLTTDFEAHNLKRGDVGAIVHRYDGGAGYEVEFVTADGSTIALLTLKPSDVRPMKSGEILHARELASV